MQRKQQPVTGLWEAGQEGGAAAKRLESECSSWRRGQWPPWGTNTPLRAHSTPRPGSGARRQRHRGRCPLSHPPSRAVAEFSPQTPPSRWRLPLPATPSVVPCSRRRAAAILSPVRLFPPLAHIYIAKIGRPGLRPSPHACSLSLLARPRPRTVPRVGRVAHLGPVRRLPNLRATAPGPPPVYGARLNRRSPHPGATPGLTAASSGPARRCAPRRPA